MYPQSSLLAQLPGRLNYVREAAYVWTGLLPTPRSGAGIPTRDAQRSLVLP